FWLLDREASRERDLIAGRLGLRFEDGPQGYYQTFYRPQDEVEFSNYLLRQVRSAYRRSPLLLLRCIAQNTVNFWVGGKTLVATVANTCLQLPLLLLALAGIPLCLKSPAGHVAVVIILFIVYLM